MSDDKTQDVNNDELTDDELEGVTGGRRLSAVSLSAANLRKTAARTAKAARPVSPSAMTSAKDVAGKVNMKNIQGAPSTDPTPLGGISGRD
ncbi:MAG: hypothetical protein ACPGU1_16035 [Myxococcota bacterium]